MNWISLLNSGTRYLGLLIYLSTLLVHNCLKVCTQDTHIKYYVKEVSKISLKFKKILKSKQNIPYCEILITKSVASITPGFPLPSRRVTEGREG